MKNLMVTTALYVLLSSHSYASIVVLNGLTHVYSGNAGDRIEGELILMNTTDLPQQITFKLNDVIFSCETNRFFTDTVSHKQSSLPWFQGSLMDKVLLPKEQFVYKYSIQIPKDQSLKGTYWSALMIEATKPVKEEQLTTNIQMDTKIRYAIGLITHVNQKENVNIDFEAISLNEDIDTVKSLKIGISNTSLFMEGVQLSLEIYDSKGFKVGERKSKREMVFPGACQQYELDISDLEKGEYECILTADSRKEFIGTNINLSVQ